MAGPTSSGRKLLHAALALGALTVVLGSSSPGSATPSPDADGISNLATCYSAKKKMAVELVIDESMSLEDSDPRGTRVDLAHAISEALVQIASVPLGEAPGRIDLQVVGFGTEVEVVVPWMRVDRKGADSLRPALESFRDRNQQVDTDYVDALTNARAHVLDHSSAMAEGRPDEVCRAVFWFTDGQFDFSSKRSFRPAWAPDLDVKGDEASILNRGRKLLCDSDGIADQFRSSETYLLTAALLNNGFTGGDETLLRNITEGGNGCGRLSGRPTGTYFSADDIRRLVINLIPPVIGPPPPPRQTSECRAGKVCVQAFRVTAATVAVNLFVDSQPGGQLSLVAPDGGVLDLRPEAIDQNIAGVKLSARAAGGTRLVTMDLTKAGATALGEWQVQFEPDSDPAHLAIWVSPRTGLSLVPLKAAAWTRGQPGTASFRVVDRKGQPLAAAEVSATDLLGRVAHGDALSDPIRLTYDPATAQATLAYTPDLTQPASSATVSVLGTVTTSAGEKTTLGASTNVGVKVANAPEAPDSLDLGVIRATRTKERDENKRQRVLPIDRKQTLTVTAPPDGAGTFCITDGSTVEVGSQRVRVRPVGKSCHRVAAGGEASIPVQISIAEPGQGGTISGYVAATTQSDLRPEKFPVSIPVRGDIVVPPGDPLLDSPTFWKLVILSLVAAGILWLALSYITSWFNSPTIIKGFRVPATVKPATSTFETPSMSSDDFDFLTAPSERTHLARYEELTITAPVRILRQQDAIVERPGHIVHGPLGAASHRRTTKGRIEHKIQGQWVFTVPAGTVVNDPTAPLEGDLYFFVRDDAFALESAAGGLLDQAKKELSARLPEIVKRLQRHAPGGPPKGRGKPSTTPEAPPKPTGQGGLM